MNKKNFLFPLTVKNYPSLLGLLDCEEEATVILSNVDNYLPLDKTLGRASVANVPHHYKLNGPGFEPP